MASDVYETLRERIADLKSQGVDPDKIVVPGDEWRGVKSQAEVLEGEGVAGGDKTLIEDTVVVFNDRLANPEVVITVVTDDE